MGKNISYTIVDDKRTVPDSADITGTIATVGIAVMGTGTKFKSELQAGSWLVDMTQNEMHRVVRVESDTVAFLEDAFSSDISAGTTPNRIPSYSKANAISAQIKSGLADGYINGVTLPNGTGVSFAKDSDRSGRSCLVDPIIVDGTGTSVQILLQK